ncbi:hypothetical protein [Geoalkalibacter ferrihydriticus]|uniref:hypothetical protein n=1 Tax=Geoalkalibacter ferrihydriticus TaxID=392333 RepID=UPI00111466F8|nr:hypothetical protein [Geoalkalibacter ferrihydriticus]
MKNQLTFPLYPDSRLFATAEAEKRCIITPNDSMASCSVARGLPEGYVFSRLAVPEIMSGTGSNLFTYLYMRIQSPPEANSSDFQGFGTPTINVPCLSVA